MLLSIFVLLNINFQKYIMKQDATNGILGGKK